VVYPPTGPRPKKGRWAPRLHSSCGMALLFPFWSLYASRSKNELLPSTSLEADVQNDDSDQHTNQQHHDHRQTNYTPTNIFETVVIASFKVLSLQGGLKTGPFLELTTLQQLAVARRVICRKLTNFVWMYNTWMWVELNILGLVCINIQCIWNYAEFDNNAWIFPQFRQPTLY